MSTMPPELMPDLEPERNFLRDAEQRLARTKRKAFTMIALYVFVAAVVLFLTKDSAGRKASPIKLPLLMTAMVVLLGGKQVSDIAHARQYVASSRRALADAESGVVYQDNFCG